MSTLLASRTRATTTRVAAVNLLPPEIAERERLRRAQAAMGGAVLLVAVLLGLVYTSARGDVAEAQTALEDAQATRSELMVEQAKFAKVPEMRAKVQAAEALLGKTMGMEVRWSSHVRELSASVPKDVWLEELSATVVADVPGNSSGISEAPTGLGTVTFRGYAKRYPDVADWLDALEKDAAYTNAYSTSMGVDVTKNKYVKFESSVELTEQALSRNNGTQQKDVR